MICLTKRERQRENDRQRGQEYLERSGNKPEDVLRATATAGEARSLETDDEISEDHNNLAEDRGDIFRCCVVRVNIGYAETMSIHQRKGEREASGRTDGEYNTLKAIIAVSEEGLRVSMTRFWRGDGDSPRVVKAMRAKRAILWERT
jgi:hypothetical protein